MLRYNKENPQKGIVGMVKAYYAMIETQERGSLHAHMLVWLHNALNPIEFKDKVKNEKFRKEMLDFLDSIIHCDFSGLTKTENEQEAIHPCCKSPDYLLNDLDDKLKFEEFKKDVYLVGASSVIHKCGPSCFKYGDGRTCRHNFSGLGKKLQEASIMDENGNIHLKRAHAYVNEFNWIMMAGLRCNHDIKYIGKSVNSSLAVVYYLTNYITKNGISTYNNLLFGLMAMKNNAKYEADNSDINNRAKKLMNSCYNAAANSTEYSAAMAAQLLLNHGRDGTYYSSHETTVLNQFRMQLKLMLMKNMLQFQKY